MPFTLPGKNVTNLSWKRFGRIREELGLGVNGTINLFLVSPNHSESYRTRTKKEYLAENERLDAPLMRCIVIVTRNSCPRTM
jgi:hypothetical protein